MPADYPLAFNDRDISYTAVGTETSFDTDYPVVDENDVDVIRTRAAVTTTLTLTTDYTVSIDPADGIATITPTGSIVAADTWRLKGNITAERTSDYQQRAGWQADEINQDFDRIWMAIQEFVRDLGAAQIAPQTLPLSLGNGGTGASYANAAALFAGIKQAATTLASGALEIATDAEAVAVTDTGRALVPSNFAGKAGQQTFVASTYTPTLTSVTNVAASTAYVAQYMRIGTIVFVSGSCDIDPTAAAPTATELGVSLPVASNFAALENCSGAGAAPAGGGATTAEAIAIVADSTNDRASLQFFATNTGNHRVTFNFMYRII